MTLRLKYGYESSALLQNLGNLLEVAGSIFGKKNSSGAKPVESHAEAALQLAGLFG